MEGRNIKTKILAIVLSLLMILISMPLNAQAASNDWTQFKNLDDEEEWVTGNLNQVQSHYVEGMSVPQRLYLSGIKDKDTHYVEFKYQFTKGYKHGYDFITNWEQAKAAANDLIGQTWKDNWIWLGIDNDKVTNLENNHYKVDIPLSGYANSQQAAFEDEYDDDRTIDVYSSSPITPSAITYRFNDEGKGDSFLYFKIEWKGNASDVLILYASHIAITSTDKNGWDDGAAQIGGSPYHNSIASGSDITGSRDHQIQIRDTSGQERADIYVEKYVSIDGGTTWVDANGKPGPILLNGTNPKFKFIVYNTGNVVLDNIELEDSEFNLNATVPALNPGEEHELIITEDWTAGQHTNTVTATTTYKGEDYTASDDANYFGAAPDIEIKKLLSIDNGETWEDASKPGPSISSDTVPKFKFIVKNIGNVDLTNVSITDDVLGEISSVGELTVNQEKEYVVTGTWESGQHENEATASGKFTDDNGKESTVSDKDKSYFFGSVTGINIKKYISIDDGNTWDDANDAPGQYITEETNPKFKFVVTNTANVELSNVDIIDDIFGDIYLDDVLTAGQVKEYVMTGTWVSGQHTNVATATGDLYVENQKITARATDPANYFGAVPSIDVEKYVWDGEEWDDADEPTGPVILSGINPQFKFVVKNTGNVDLENIKLEDTVFDLSEDIVAYSLQVANEDRFRIIDFLAASGDVYGLDEFELIITAPWAKGPHTNRATVSGGYGVYTYSDYDDANYLGKEREVIDYELVITKVADVDEYDAIGDEINYTIKVKNTGNTRLTGVEVTDSLIDNLIRSEDYEDGILEPGEEWTFTGTYKIVQADINRGSVLNTAKADSNETGEVTDSVTVDYDKPSPPSENRRYRMTIDKKADVKEYSQAGDVIVYTITLRNTGNTALSDVEVSDTMLKNLTGPEGDDNDNNRLDVNETWVYEGSYTVTEEDMQKKSLINTAKAESGQTNPVESSVTVNKTEEEVEILDEETALGVPEVIIEEPEVPQATLPDTGAFMNTSILAAIGSAFVLSGIGLGRKKRK